MSTSLLHDETIFRGDANTVVRFNVIIFGLMNPLIIREKRPINRNLFRT
jgi:hypothetical protein